MILIERSITGTYTVTEITGILSSSHSRWSDMYILQVAWGSRARWLTHALTSLNPNMYIAFTVRAKAFVSANYNNLLTSQRSSTGPYSELEQFRWRHNGTIQNEASTWTLIKFDEVW